MFTHSPLMSKLLITLLLPCLLVTCAARSAQPAQGVVTSQRAGSYRAAVYEHAVTLPPPTDTPVSRKVALENMQKNLDVYKVQTEAAKSQGAEILVFPEDGIYGYIFTRETIYPYLEVIPDPKVITWSPCDDPNRFPDTEVQRYLSCLAKNNSLYVVANMGDSVPCNPSSDSDCPPDGRYQYNTAVAYGPDGTLQAKYHKTNLYYEFQFNTPKPEVVYFDTPFGRFGFLICFDILYKDPAVPMVTEHNIHNVLFPTAWMDSLPLLSAIGFHSSFARGYGVNVLAANLHRPADRFQGSGLYTAEGMQAFYYNRTDISEPRLIVGDLESSPKSLSRSRNFGAPQSEQHKHDDTISVPQNSRPNFMSAEPQGEGFLLDLLLNHASPVSSFQNKNYTFTQLDGVATRSKVCSGRVCCHLNYQMTDIFSSDMLVLGAFDGLFHGKYYFQTCAVLRCPSTDATSCGSYTFESNTGFRHLTLTAEVTTPYVLPQVVVTNGGQLELAQADQWSFENSKTLSFAEGLTTPLIEAAIVGRDYSRDP